MNNLTLYIIALLSAAFLFVGSFYIAFDYYNYEKETKIAKDVAMVLANIENNNQELTIPYSSEMVFVIKKGTFIFRSNNLVNHPIDQTLYHGATQKLGNTEVVIGIKKTNFRDIISFFFTNPISIGMLLVAISLFGWVIFDIRSKRANCFDEEFIERLKALRLSIATSKIIPLESAEEAKRIIDLILGYVKGSKE